MQEKMKIFYREYNEKAMKCCKYLFLYISPFCFHYNLPGTWLHKACTVSSEMLFQRAFDLFFRAVIFGWFEEQALLSRILQIAKSMGFRSGDQRGHNSFGQNPVMFLLHHSWMRLAVWDVAPSCWRIISLSPNVALIQGTNLFFNKSRYICWFTLTPSSMKMRGVFSPLEVTLAQTITEVGVCIQSLSLSLKGVTLLFTA